MWSSDEVIEGEVPIFGFIGSEFKDMVILEWQYETILTDLNGYEIVIAVPTEYWLKSMKKQGLDYWYRTRV